ncbi:MAG: hypothetical protein IH926_06350 [Proteobacteria bacterium]|nr:hypothetical protein [Pseudomonadota bacterium]
MHRQRDRIGRRAAVAAVDRAVVAPEVVSGIRVADAALIVVAAPAGVEVGTRQMWQMSDDLGLPRMIFISKMDRENADFQRAMQSLTSSESTVMRIFP